LAGEIMILITSLFDRDHLYLTRWELVKLFLGRKVTRPYVALTVSTGKPK